MKSTLLLFAALIVTVTYAGERKSILRQSYVVVSDVYSELVPVGQCVVTGNVYSPDYYGSDDQVMLSGVQIATLDHKKSTQTDAEGKYKLTLDSKDTSIYAFSAGYEEIVIWKYQFRSQHVVTINFFPGYNSNMYEADKPVIYLYSENELDAELHIACKGAVTFTYPAYQDGWNVRVTRDGLKDKETGKTHPYLFWEGQIANLDFVNDENVIPGFIISTDTVVSFLENSLTAMGLNQTEKTDFITFWAPRMIAEPYAMVQFLTNEAYEKEIAEMTITPSPESLLRIYMFFSPMKTDQISMNVQAQTFEPFVRKGFTVVEWGGTELDPIILIP